MKSQTVHDSSREVTPEPEILVDDKAKDYATLNAGFEKLHLDGRDSSMTGELSRFSKCSVMSWYVDIKLLLPSPYTGWYLPGVAQLIGWTQSDQVSDGKGFCP